MYKYKTIIIDYNGREYRRKHRTEKQMRIYIEHMLQKGNCHGLFAYQIEDINNQYPYIQIF